MKRFIGPLCLCLVLSATLQIRLSHDLKKGYSYQISGPDLEEVVEADKKLRQYLRSQAPAPKKTSGPAPSTPAPRPAPHKP
ncbi:MAG: hypothetical protein HY892_17430 [Deltaproteobacteria bacterium]|nr:hypothetical protein [Deltaproteobacteria bacterium]